MQSPSNAHQPPSEEIQISDEVAYNNYVSSLGAIFESHERLVRSVDVDTEWFIQIAAQARRQGASIGFKPTTNEPTSSTKMLSRQDVASKMQQLESSVRELESEQIALREQEEAMKFSLVNVEIRNKAQRSQLMRYLIWCFVCGSCPFYLPSSQGIEVFPGYYFYTSVWVGAIFLISLFVRSVFNRDDSTDYKDLYKKSETEFNRIRQSVNKRQDFGKKLIGEIQFQSKLAMQHAERMKGEFISSFEKELLPELRRTVDVIFSSNFANVIKWDDEYWSATDNQNPERFHASSLGFEPNFVRVGEVYMEQPAPFQHVAILPIQSVGDHRGHVVISSNAADRRLAALTCLKSIAVRSIASFPVRKFKAVFIDPIGMGNNFPVKNFPEFIVGPKVYTRSEEIREQLGNLIVHIEQVIQKYLSADYKSIKEYNQAKSFIKESYRYVFITDFPTGFDISSFEDLKSILINGPRAGVFVVLHLDESLDKPRGFDYDVFADYCSQISPIEAKYNGKPLFRMHINRKHWVNVILDKEPSNEQINIVAPLVSTAFREAPVETLPFSELELSQDKVWSSKSNDEIRTPIGISGAVDRLEFWLGENVDGEIASSAILAGKPGAGKSYTLHAIIINLASRYSPDELEMYLLDFKEGVEFQVYVDPLKSESTDPSAELDETRALPHAKVISIQSDREFGLSVLERNQQEIQRRGQQFTSVGVDDLKNFRSKHPDSHMPRVLIVIDEFQYMFLMNDEITRKLNLIFEDICRRGRAFGIHLLLATQSPNVHNMNSSIYSYIDLRMAQQMDRLTAARVLAEGNVDAIELINRPGEIIYNAAHGKAGHNNFGRIVNMSLDARKQALTRIHEFAKEKDYHRADPLVVFTGSQAGKLKRNRMLQQLIRMDDWVSPRELKEQIINDQELDLKEFPIVAWLGESMKIGEHIHATFRRRTRNNMLMIGSSEPSIFGMLGGIILSVAHCYIPKSVSFEIIDLSNPDEDNPWTYLTTQLRDAIGNLYDMNIGKRSPDKTKNISRYQTILRKVNDELARREAIRKGDPDETNFGQPIFFICAIGALERAQDLRPVMGQRNEEPSEDGKTFIKIVSTGSDLGIHTILWLDSTISFFNLSADSRAWLTHFDLRVAMKMPAANSIALIKEPFAEQLTDQQAYFTDTQKTTLNKFKPYAVPSVTELHEYGDNLRNRSSSKG